MTHEQAEQIHRDDLARAVKALPKLPRNAPRIDRLRRIVEEHQAARVEGKVVDATTANMLVSIHDALNEKNRAHFLALPLPKMVALGWKLVSKG